MEQTTKKMLIRDVAVVVGFVAFLWVTMIFIILSILAAIGPSPEKNIIIAIGIGTLLFATLSLVVLIAHLHKHRKEMYAEELRHANGAPQDIACDVVAEKILPSEDAPKEESHSIIVKIFDIMFVMVLCFVTLLATMLLRGKTDNGANIYAWNMRTVLPSVLVTVVGFTLYFLYILRHSHKELKIMVDEMYSEEETPTLIPDEGAR